ncbi:hypothetical protein DES41_10381 [Pseudorhodoferax soli]|uniref:Uncharacterized protein n=1 Tax=Pseudorhodoferax soli TaxID=545864 RepID=A0A368XZ99_9BURK|nr:hypothetical protein DES41_10381 [Pseudorhodoferax soli]
MRKMILMAIAGFLWKQFKARQAAKPRAAYPRDAGNWRD